MRAFVDRRQIELQDIELDRARWDQASKASASLANRKTLYVELVESDLIDLGTSLFAAYRRCLKDPEFFDSELMEDVPRPKSEKVFLEKPFAIKRYMKPGSFWRDHTIHAIVSRINPWKTGETRYWIEEFRDVKVDPPYTILIFSARMQTTRI